MQNLKTLALAGPGPDWMRWVARGMVVYALLFALYTLLQPLGETGRLIVGDLIFIPANLVAGLLCLVAQHRATDRQVSTGWGFIGVGMLSWAIADSVWAWQELVLGILPESPNSSDLFYLVAYPLIFIGLLMFPSGGLGRLSRAKILLDVSVVATAAGMVSWYGVIAPILMSEMSTILGRIIELAYPSGDLILIWAVLRLYFDAQTSQTRSPMFVLMIGFGFMAVADIWYALLAQAGLYETGHMVDILWVAAGVTVAFAALIQIRQFNGEHREGSNMDLTEKRIDKWKQALPYAAVVATYALLGAGTLSSSVDVRQIGVLLGAGAILILVLIRQAVTLTENANLNNQLRTFSKELARRVQDRTEDLQQANQRLEAEIAERKQAQAGIEQALQEKGRLLEQIEASLREKETLLKEIHHRVKNNMQVISSLLQLQAGRCKDPETKAAFHDSQQRIHSMALLHERLYRSENLAQIDFADYLQILVQQLIRSSSGIQVKTLFDLEPLSTSLDTALPCGLIVNELVSNCLKHAFVDRRDGTISVSLHHLETGQVVLKVRGNGRGLPDGLDIRKTKTLGLQLVNSLARQVGGTIALEQQDGTAVAITFPLAT